MPKYLALEDRVAAFWANADQSGGPRACWPWKRSRNAQGYGRVRWFGKLRRTNRVALELKLGRPLKPGHESAHECDNPPCCNPACLFEATQSENSKDAVGKGRKRAPQPTAEQRARGERVSTAKLTPDLVRALRADRAAGLGYRRLANKYGLTKRGAKLVADGESWAHVA